jgi:uncharacterized protein (DUF2225 family)
MSYTVSSILTDFQKQGAIGDLYESSVNSCPKCHYCGYESDFDTTFTNAKKHEILKIIEPYKNLKITDVLENEIAVKIHQYFNSNNSVIAHLYLIASYIIKGDSLQTDKRKELQLNCAVYLSKAIDSKAFIKKGTYASINYLIGELYRRIGNFDDAIKHYDLALYDKDIQDELLEVVTKQKELAIKKDDDNSI